MSIEITVRSLRELDTLVAEHITKPFSKAVLNHNPGLAPEYTTWAGMDLLITNRKNAGYQWRIQWGYPGQADEYAAELSLGKATHSRYARSAPIALCLAALASAGCRVRLELEDGND